MHYTYVCAEGTHTSLPLSVKKPRTSVNTNTIDTSFFNKEPTELGEMEDAGLASADVHVLEYLLVLRLRTRLCSPKITCRHPSVLVFGTKLFNEVITVK